MKKPCSSSASHCERDHFSLRKLDKQEEAFATHNTWPLVEKPRPSTGPEIFLNLQYYLFTTLIILVDQLFIRTT